MHFHVNNSLFRNRDFGGMKCVLKLVDCNFNNLGSSSLSLAAGGWV